MKWDRHPRTISQSAVDGHAAAVPFGRGADQGLAQGWVSEGRPTGQAWLFPAAADALSALDPREVFTVEFLFRDGSIARSTFEAGGSWLWSRFRTLVRLGLMCVFCACANLSRS